MCVFSDTFYTHARNHLGFISSCSIFESQLITALIVGTSNISYCRYSDNVKIRSAKKDK
jgi:hypothetical protein